MSNRPIVGYGIQDNKRLTKSMSVTARAFAVCDSLHLIVFKL